MAKEYGKSHMWARKQLDKVVVEFKFYKIQPRKVMLVIDTTYCRGEASIWETQIPLLTFGKRRQATELDGVMVFVDSVTGQVLWAKFVKSETNMDYQEGLNYLESRGFEILGVISDGRRGLAGIFSKYPYQICQFHVQKGVSTLLTRNPKSVAGKELKQFNDTFIKLKLTKAQFLEQIEIYLKTNQEYINEMSENNQNEYKHLRLRKALNKYRNNSKHLFTYQNYSQIQFPNTTNKIDGGLFSPMKNLLRNHNGTTKQRRKNMIIEYINSRGSKI